jgi:hypothetical protein
VQTYEDPFSPQERNAYLLVEDLFRRAGLGTLAPRILEFAKAGYNQDTIELMLQDTEEYKTRFAANEARRAKGLRVLGAGEYLGLEEKYG